MNELQKATYFTEKLIEKGFCTDDYNDWVLIGLELSSLGEDGRELFHKLSQTSNKYDCSECDTKYDTLLKNRKNLRDIASFFYRAIHEFGFPSPMLNGRCKHNGNAKNYKQDPKRDKESRESTNTSEHHFFNVRTANQCMKEASNQPPLSKLFDEFWYTSEMCIFFSDTNQGKSILGVQIADSISRGVPIDGFKIEVEAQKVLYFDFELSDKQFEVRYSETEMLTKQQTNHHKWSDNFYRINLSDDFDLPEGESFESSLLKNIEQQVIKLEAKVIIIDNLTYLGSDLEKTKNASKLVKDLKAMGKRLSCSILIIAHTPKLREIKNISIDHLQGSKMLANFCDSAFAVGSSFEPNVKYLKQLKVRSSELKYSRNNVIRCEISKKGNFLEMRFLGYSNEEDLIKNRRGRGKTDDEIIRIRKLRKEGLSIRDIAKELNISKSTVQKYIKKDEENEKRRSDILSI